MAFYQLIYKSVFLVLFSSLFIFSSFSELKNSINSKNTTKTYKQKESHQKTADKKYYSNNKNSDLNNKLNFRLSVFDNLQTITKYYISYLIPSSAAMDGLQSDIIIKFPDSIQDTEKNILALPKYNTGLTLKLKQTSKDFFNQQKLKSLKTKCKDQLKEEAKDYVKTFFDQDIGQECEDESKLVVQDLITDPLPDSCDKKENRTKYIGNKISLHIQKCLKKKHKAYTKECKQQITEAAKKDDIYYQCEKPGGDVRDAMDVKQRTKKSCKSWCESAMSEKFQLRVSDYYNEYYNTDIERNSLEHIKLFKFSIETLVKNDIVNALVKTNPEITRLCDENDSEDTAGCDVELKKHLLKAQEVCHTKFTKTDKCCNHPEKCLIGQAAHSAFGLLSKLYKDFALGSGKNQNICNSQSQIALAQSAMVGSGIAKCSDLANSCSTECSGKVTTFKDSVRIACNYDIDEPKDYKKLNKDNYTYKYERYKFYCSKELLTDLIKPYRGEEKGEYDHLVQIGVVPTLCDKLDKEGSKSIEEAVLNLAAGTAVALKNCPNNQSGDEVAIAAVTSNQVINDTDIPVQGMVGLGAGGNEDEDSLIINGPNPYRGPTFDDMPEGLEDISNNENSKPADSSGSGLITSGGPGGLGGGGAAPGGGSARGRRGNNRRSKSSANILKGYKSSKGFNGYGGGGVSEGTTRRGRNKRRRDRNKRNKILAFNLNKFVPKGKLMNNKVGKFGSSHENIFQRISNRLNIMCSKKTLSCTK